MDFSKNLIFNSKSVGTGQVQVSTARLGLGAEAKKFFGALGFTRTFATSREKKTHSLTSRSEVIRCTSLGLAVLLFRKLWIVWTVV